MNAKRLIHEQRFYLSVEGYYRDTFRDFRMSFHAHPRTELLYAEEGSFSVTFRGDDGVERTLTAEKGMFVFVEADVLHSMTVDGQARILNVEFGSHELYRGALVLPMDLIIRKNRKLAEFLKNRSEAALLTDFFNVKDIVDRIHTEMDTQHCILNEENFSMVQSLTDQLFITMGRCYDCQMEKFKGVIHVKKAVEYINRHLQDKMTVPEIAHYVGINATYLQKVFKSVQNATIIDYINAARVNRAVTLIQNSDFPLVDIAAEVGFDNRQNFYAAFKRIYGMGPMQYKREWKSDNLFMLPDSEKRRERQK